MRQDLSFGKMVAQIVFVSIALLITTQLYAQQELFRTDNGNMVITTELNDSPLVLRTKELIVVLNYENAEFKIVLDRSTLSTGVDSIDQKLRLLEYDPITYTGKLGLDYINTKGHPPLDFKVEGYLSTNNEQIIGSGRLEHLLEGTNYACLLSMVFQIKIEDLGLDLVVDDLADEVQFEVIQTVLRRETD